LLEQEGHGFVVRLMAKVKVEGGGFRGLLSGYGLRPGQAADLGWVLLRQDGAVKVRVIGIWAKGQGEPWWLATNLAEPVQEIGSLYDRRMGIEQQIRDTKGSRFGFRLFWTQIRRPEALARLTLLVGIALILLTVVGKWLSDRKPELRLPSKKKGPRLSLVSVALRHLEQTLKEVMIDLAWVRAHLPEPELRKFAWIDRAEGGKKKC
jgi:hypothetical protein